MQYLARAAHLDLAKDVRVTTNQFGADMLEDVAKIKITLLARNLCVQVDLEQQVSKFLGQLFHVVLLQRFHHLVGFLDHVVSQRLMGLLAVPRAAIRVAAQAHGDVAQRLGQAQGCQLIERRHVKRT